MRPFRGFLHYVSPERRRRRSDEGFSLIETLAALLVFGIITLGLIPLLAASIRGSETARTYVSGKNVAVKAMERIRSLPYYVSYATQAKRVDVLDIYFPNTSTTFSGTTCNGYIAAAGTCTPLGNRALTGPTYVTYCTATQTGTGCPDRLPGGYSVLFEASFVGVSAATTSCPAPATGTCEQYTKAAPTGYAYNSVGGDIPAKLLMEMVVTSFWTVNGRRREHQVRSLISDRRFGGLKLFGEAVVEYGVQVVTGFDPPGTGANKEATELSATAAQADARIEARRSSYASLNVRTGDASLTDVALAVTDPATATLASIAGLTSTLQTPPDSGPTNLASSTDVALSFPGGGSYDDVAYFDDTDSTEVKVGVTGGAAACGATVPCAHGNFDFSPGTGTIDFWVSNKQADVSNELNFEDDEIVEVIPFATNSLQGDVNAIANAIGSGVDARAQLTFWELRMFRSDDIDDHSVVANEFGSAVVSITGPSTGATASTITGPFTATATCDASTSGAGGTASADYAGTLWYYADNDPAGTNDGLSAADEDGSYRKVDLAATGTDPLAAIETENPFVYDAPGGNEAKDVYLFEIPAGSTSTSHPAAHAHNHPGYLLDWSTLTSPSESVTSAGRVTSAQLDKSLSIQTSEMEPGTGPVGEEFTSLSVSVGAVSCRAEDYR